MTTTHPWAEGGEILSEPHDDRHPWVVANGDRVLKAYDLRAFDEVDRRWLRFEADTAISLSDIPGVVTTYRTEEVGHWFVIEMERLGDPLAAYLDPRRADALPPVSHERWGVLFEKAANTLEEIHRRHLTHHDIKPANLLFDRAGGRLVVTDFSVSAKRTRLRRADARPALPGTPRYIAPEQFDGRSGPKVDQFALGVSASDILGDGLSPRATLVLLRATSQEPEERFARISDFGAALRSALDHTAPRRLSTRLQTVAPEWRYGWGPAAAVMAAAYLAILLVRNPRVTVAEGISVPLAAGAATALILRLFAPRLARRTQPRLRVANRTWFPAAVAAVLIAALWPLINDNPDRNAKYVLYAGGAALLLTAALGSVPRDAGAWLVLFVSRWERWRAAQRKRPLAWWSVRFAVLALLGIAVLLPAAVADRWPRRPGPDERAAPEPIMLVAQLRAAMLAGHNERICTLVNAPDTPGVMPCATWAPVAAGWVRDDVRAGAPRFVPAQIGQVAAHYLARSTRDGGSPGWDLYTLGEHREHLGAVTHPVDSDEVWMVSVTRAQDPADPAAIAASEWRYEVVRRQRRWRVSAVQVCNYHAAEGCVTVSQLSAAQLDGYERRGVP